MKRYGVRAIKYLVLLCVIYLGIMALMYHTGTMGLPTVEGFWETLSLQLFHTQRGRWMIPALLLLAALYPRFGFVKRTVSPCDWEANRTQIENAFKAYGFQLVACSEQEMRFRGGHWTTRLQYLFEEEICVRRQGEGVELEGIRRAAVKIAFRLEGYLSHLR